MDTKQLFIFYEKLYFHEIDSRDKVTMRLQLPLAIIISIVSLLGYILKGSINLNHTSLILNIGLVISILVMIASIYYFIKAFFGHDYDYIPVASDTEEYRNQLLQYYKDYDDGVALAEDTLFDYLYECYQICSSTNAEVNANRSQSIHNSILYIILSIFSVAIVFVVFTFESLNL